MSGIGFGYRRNQPSARAGNLSADGRRSRILGLLALLVGIVASAGAAYLGLAASARFIALPGGLPAAHAETVAIVVFACGTITMMLGVMSLYRAYMD